MDEHQQLQRAREAAHACKRAAEHLVQFADRLTAVVGPAEMAEYDTLVAREAAAHSERVEAFAALGLAVPSLDGEVSDRP
jgi:hypothetical protein